MMDVVSEARLGEVMPALADKIRTLADALALEDIVIRVTQGLRSWAQQDALYQQGRALVAGTLTVVDKGKIVTNCPGGHSWHNFGMACDVVPDFADTEPFAPDWDLSHPAWQRIVNLGVSIGLDSGANWRTFKDWPHLQLTGRFPEGAPTDEVRQLFRDGGMSAVWDALGSA